MTGWNALRRNDACNVPGNLCIYCQVMVPCGINCISLCENLYQESVDNVKRHYLSFTTLKLAVFIFLTKKNVHAEKYFV